MVKRGDWKRWKRMLMTAYLVLTATGLTGYIDWWSAGFITGLIALALTPASNSVPVHPFRYAIVSGLFFILYILLPVKTLLYLSLVPAFLFFCDTFIGKMPGTTSFIVLLMSPIAAYVLDVFSFPIRMELSAAAGAILFHMGSPVRVEGNVLHIRGQDLSVDPACMGLHMLVVSLLTGLLLMNLYQSRYQRKLRIIPILSVLVLIVALNIVMNVCRIVALASFNILPDNPMHGLVGIGCLVIYVMLPAMRIARWVVRRFGVGVPNDEPVYAPVRAKPRLAANIILCFAMVSGVIAAAVRGGKRPVLAGAIGPVAGYTVTTPTDHVVQLDNGRALVYIKFIPDWYYTDHQPTICWRGSGYSFVQINKERRLGQWVYRGQLQNGPEQLYTAWWYDNGSRRTINQLEWRWDVLSGGHKYAIVNITASSQEELVAECDRALQKKTFRALLQRGY